jgi:hypothetical protein
MGNYKDLELEFIDRTIKLIDQYYAILDNYPFEEQFNYTLTINCLLGIIVMPKERIMSYVPKNRLTNEFKRNIGLNESIISENATTLKILIQSLRHSIAHFNIKVVSESDKNLIDWLEFYDNENGGRLIARFKSTELLPFLKYYTNALMENMSTNRR